MSTRASSQNSIQTSTDLRTLASEGCLDFAGLEIPEATLVGIELRGADLCGCVLAGANLTGANLVDAELRDADLRGANLSGASLRDADLSGADLSGAKLNNADLGDALLPCANLSGTECYGAMFRGADLNEADLRRATLETSVLAGAHMAGADLRGSSFRWANLTGASMKGADVRGCSLEEANLTEANVTGIRFNRATRFRGAEVASCRGNPVFKRYALDQDYVEAFREGHPVAYWVWLIVSDCGRSLTLWAAWAVFVAMAFAGVYWLLPEHLTVHGVACDVQGACREVSPLTYLYYSVSTFTTLGFGDVVPRSWVGELLAITEVTLGYLMLGGVVSILANKLARRA